MQDTRVEIEDFHLPSCRTIIGSCDREGYDSRWHQLSSAASAAVEAGRTAEGKVLRLLAAVCSMTFNTGSINEPLKQRFELSEDFQTSDIMLFSKMAEEVDDVWLKARLADLAWLRQKPCNPKHALLAIDAYRSIPLDKTIWMRDGQECWQRAISLTKMLKTGAGERMRHMERSIMTAFEATKKEDNFWALWLSDFIAVNDLNKDKGSDISNKLESIARAFDAERDLHRARAYFGAAAKWFQRAGNGTKTIEMTVFIAEGCVKEAAILMSSKQPSYMVAAGLYEQAIQIYLTIPRVERVAHRVDERIAELHSHLREAGKNSLGEMGAIIPPAIDITEIIENARNSVRGRPSIEALAAFSNVYSGIRVAQVRENSERMLREHPLHIIFPATYRSIDGRVIAKLPGMAASDTNSKEYQTRVWIEMVDTYKMEISLVVQGSIWPALEVVLLEHRLRESDFVSIASRSTIVPKDRERSFGKALFAGYDKDFAGALHLLVPQIEHMTRWHLNAAGIKTTHLDKDGIENEYGLGKLVDLPDLVQIFGEDLAFELKALFCDAFGPNLRNNLAHGLLDDNSCQSAYSVYAWWFSLRLVFKTFWNARRKEGTEASPEAEL
ncbi:MAG TPA: DUF4209 domain-containing protein [Thermoanaerobaculia bacterium]|nr:DUF4209 domain-containing protein [Thermoanaerobaculia bacterium]